LSDETLTVLGLARVGTPVRKVPLRPQHQAYMKWHRDHVFVD
jgi:hypothetical protein